MEGERRERRSSFLVGSVASRRKELNLWFFSSFLFFLCFSILTDEIDSAVASHLFKDQTETYPLNVYQKTEHIFILEMRLNARCYLYY